MGIPARCTHEPVWLPGAWRRRFEVMTRTDTAPLRAWLGLLVILGPVLLVAMDGSVLFLAMPAITAALTPTADQSLWILDSYGFAVGALLIAFGALGDRYGRLRLLLTGATVFGIASAAAAFAPGPEILIGLRVLMGVAGATLLPSALAILSTLFADPRQRAQAIGVFAATFAAGFALGPIVAGQLLTRFWWGSVLLINLPVLLVFLVLAPLLLREVREARTGRVDVASVLASAAGLLLTMYAVKHAAAAGPSGSGLGAGFVGLALLTWFARRQSRIANPLVDFGLFRNPVFAIAIVTGFLPLAAWSATAYLASAYLQSVLGLSVARAALLAVPGAVVLTVAAVLTPVVVGRTGRSAALIGAHFFIAAGLFLLLFAGTGGGTGWYVASTAVAGIGYGISFSVVADIAVAAVPPARAGSAAALAETGNELGNAVGIAVFGSLAALLFRLTGPELAPTLGETAQVAGIAPAALADARAAFVTGLHAVAAVAGVLHVVLGVVAVRVLSAQLGHPRRHHLGDIEQVVGRRHRDAVQGVQAVGAGDGEHGRDPRRRAGVQRAGADGGGDAGLEDAGGGVEELIAQDAQGAPDVGVGVGLAPHDHPQHRGMVVAQVDGGVEVDQAGGGITGRDDGVQIVERAAGHAFAHERGQDRVLGGEVVEDQSLGHTGGRGQRGGRGGVEALGGEQGFGGIQDELPGVAIALGVAAPDASVRHQ